MALFGDILRRWREEARVSLGVLARHLGVSTPYLSGVERNRKAPLATAKIFKAATYLGKDPRELFEAAAEYAGHLTLETSNEKAMQAGAALARTWQSMTPEDYDQVIEFVANLEERRDRDG